MRFRTVAVAAAVILAWSLPASAQQPVSLQFQDGRVTLVARNAPVRTILGEWARLGGATIVNGERLTGAPVTLELTAVSERDALAILLRDVAGYLLAPRPAGTAGVSAFNRIVILPTSEAPRTPQPAVGAVQRPAFQRMPVPVRPPAPDPPDELPVDEPGDVEPQSVAPPAGPPRPVRSVFTGPRPSGVQVLTPDDDGTASEPAAQPAGTPPSAGNPFGVPAGSSSMPGTIAPAPPQRPESNPVQ